MKLAGGSLTPLYQQVMDDIRQDIESARYRPNQKIPSEAELSEMYSVSRITIRRAVEELSNEGYLTKRQGKGTYVNRARLVRKTLSFADDLNFVSLCEESGLVAEAIVLECARVTGDTEAKALLGLDESDDLLLLRRLLTADGVPVIYEMLVMPYSRCSRFGEESLDEPSLSSTLERLMGARPTRGANRILEVVRASIDLADTLGVPVGEPLYSIRGIICDDSNAPLMLGQLLMSTTVCAFSI